MHVREQQKKARVRGLLHIEVQELYRIAAMRHGGNNEEMDAEFDRLMSRNQSSCEYQALLRNRASGFVGAQATETIWENERAARRNSGRLYYASLTEQDFTNCLPYLLPGSVTQLSETCKLANIVTHEKRNEIILRRWQWQSSGRKYCRIYRKRLMRFLMSRWLQLVDPAADDWVRLRDPIPLDDPLGLAEIQPGFSVPRSG